MKSNFKLQLHKLKMTVLKGAKRKVKLQFIWTKTVKPVANKLS